MLNGAEWLCAAALAVALAPYFREPPCTARAQWKGGDVTLSLVGEQHGAHAQLFGQHERFRLRVTCPPPLAGKLRAAVYQAGVRYEPLADGALPGCGNALLWPGAFALDGYARVFVCVRWDGAPWPAHAPDEARGSRCVAVDPAL